jgi:hypothetical protein
MANILASGTVYRLYHPKYQIFTGQSSSLKSGNTRFSISTKSLDFGIGTFQTQNRDTISLTTTASGEYGNPSFHKAESLPLLRF